MEFARRSHHTVISSPGADLVVEVDGVPHRVSREDGGVVRALGSALVVSLPVSAGDVVEAGDVVAVVEAMKMESSLTAPFRGRVKEVFVGQNFHVTAQTPLLALEPVDHHALPPAGRRLDFAPLAASSDTMPDPCRENSSITSAIAALCMSTFAVEKTDARRHNAVAAAERLPRTVKERPCVSPKWRRSA